MYGDMLVMNPQMIMNITKFWHTYITAVFPMQMCPKEKPVVHSHHAKIMGWKCMAKARAAAMNALGCSRVTKYTVQVIIHTCIVNTWYVRIKNQHPTL